MNRSIDFSAEGGRWGLIVRGLIRREWISTACPKCSRRSSNVVLLNTWKVHNARYGRLFRFCWGNSLPGILGEGDARLSPQLKNPWQGIGSLMARANASERMGNVYVMENVRTAHRFVGPSAQHCGPSTSGETAFLLYSLPASLQSTEGFKAETR